MAGVRFPVSVFNYNYIEGSILHSILQICKRFSHHHMLGYGINIYLQLLFILYRNSLPDAC